MSNLIKKMRDGELFPIRTLNSGEEYDVALDKVCTFEQKILDSYPGFEELLNEFESAQFDLEKINAAEEFVSGFKIGARLMMEILNSD